MRLSTIFLITTLLFTIVGKAQDNPIQKKAFTFSLIKPYFFESWYKRKSIRQMYLLSSEYSNVVGAKQNVQYAMSFGIGMAMRENTNILVGSNDFSLLFGKKYHKVEFGIGYLIAEGVNLHYNIGYRGRIGNSLIIRILYNPSFEIGDYLEDDSGESIISRKISFSLGYQLTQNNTKKVSNTLSFFTHHSSIETQIFFIHFEKKAYSPLPPIMFNYSLLPIKINEFHFAFNLGAGFMSEGSIFYQTGIAMYYGKRRHFIEGGINIIYAFMGDYNNEYQYSNCRLIQPQLGYRYQPPNSLFFARIAYAPYIRTLKGKFEGGLKHNMVLGVGVRFSRK